jgi:sulfopyruvate decarboxylase TPP-binding subunit
MCKYTFSTIFRESFAGGHGEFIPAQLARGQHNAVMIKTNMLKVFKIDSGKVYLFIYCLTNTVPENKR